MCRLTEIFMGLVESFIIGVVNLRGLFKNFVIMGVVSIGNFAWMFSCIVMQFGGVKYDLVY